ncbi:tetratricopeptide repeat protein [Hyphomicrobium sp.]|uniref:tetratricopeptide repeat protein n=1 Tax=Hyphomicrobium sp. TaxID=82 RepID=UPI002E37DDCD|nr:tetratricopeptide repeat protein [Hyphomicrobium sp.]HEX2842613.1 tetratricopeptide repeat protein [Hyphomicrobium sp.]
MSRLLLGSAFGLALAIGVLIAPHASLAAMDEPSPRPKLDCGDISNTDKQACAPQNGQLSDDQIYESAYLSAKNGNYQAAIAMASQAQNKEDPRILRVTGFATRKLGDVDGAMPYYQKALDINPGDTKTREYMGEAFLSLGELAKAREQLREIEKHCGVSCEDYQTLADAIAASHVRFPRG